jgi:hypothetical protein
LKPAVLDIQIRPGGKSEETENKIKNKKYQ